MVGIIYKFTIMTNGRFYVGQHEAKSFEDFMIAKPSFSSCYWGSGSAIWEHVLKKHIDSHPDDWHKLVKREVLICLSKYTSVLLNKMERYFIKKTKSHYTFNEGGCNFLWGEARGDDWVNAMKLPEVRLKAANKNRVSLKGKMSGEKHWNFGKHRPDEVKRKISLSRLGKTLSDETKKKLSEMRKGKPKSEIHKKRIRDAQLGEKSVHFGKHLTDEHKKKLSLVILNRIWINNGIEEKRVKPEEEIPNGWTIGRKKKSASK